MAEKEAAILFDAQHFLSDIIKSLPSVSRRTNITANFVKIQSMLIDKALLYTHKYFI